MGSGMGKDVDPLIVSELCLMAQLPDILHWRQTLSPHLRGACYTLL